MTIRGFVTTAVVIFGIIAFLQGLRFVFGWEAVVAGWLVPRAVSLVAMMVAGAMALWGWRVRG